MTQPIPAEVVSAAQKAQVATGIPASTQIAQWAVESAWGSKSPGNNPFGIKARPGEPHVVFTTHEVVHGRKIQVLAAFRAFPSIADAFVAHADLLHQEPRYAPARAVLPSVERFCDQLEACGYATDPNYAETLRSVIAANGLKRFDALPAAFGHDATVAAIGRPASHA